MIGMDVTIRQYEPGDEHDVVDLWRQCGLLRAWTDAKSEIARNQKSADGRLLVATSGVRLVATVMAGYDGRRGWINYVAVAPPYQRTGVGRAMMEAAEAYFRELDCPKVNLQVRQANHGAMEFYRALGYEVDEVVSLGKRLVGE